MINPLRVIILPDVGIPTSGRKRLTKHASDVRRRLEAFKIGLLGLSALGHLYIGRRAPELIIDREWQFLTK
jgi:hypothetical protein